MNLRNLLSVDTICLELKSTSKESIIEEMVDLLVASGKIQHRTEALSAVLDRERKMSTGMQNGIAIPHGKTEKVEALVATLALKKEGADFDALDGQPSKIFVMTLSPEGRSGPHIQFLAEISRLLSDASVRTRLLNASSPEDILQLLSG
jgi:PTS system nitrogen regulatory IIA component